MSDYKIYSADSHVSEPGDLWVERIDKEYQFRAPRLERRERNGKMEDLWIYEGFPPHPVGVGLGAASKTGDVDASTASFRDEQKGYSDARAGGWDPAERIKDQDLDGVEGELLYTTLGFRLYWMEDDGLKRACFRVYNDWLAEFCSYDRYRYTGLALLSLTNIPEAIKELTRAANLGHVGAMIPLSPAPGDPPYTSELYDPFWAAAQDLNMTMVLHENTGGAESRLSPSSYWDPHMSVGSILRPHEVQRTLAHLVVSGVFERFPSLRVVSAENGTDWIPWFVNRVAKHRGGSLFPTKLSMKPIEYLHRNVSFTYINEQEAVNNVDLVGIDNLMFSTDYPHSASTWPKSQQIVARDFEDLDDSVRRKLIHDNVLKTFNIKALVPA
jgi:predicted TIM-barrel fold metal-dependent hydrolase